MPSCNTRGGVAVILNDRLKAAMERAAELPAPLQDELAKLVEEALSHITQPSSQLSPEWRASVEWAMREQAETLEYLNDK